MKNQMEVIKFKDGEEDEKLLSIQKSAKTRETPESSKSSEVTTSPQVESFTIS